MAKYLGRFNSFPKELFRLNNGDIIRVRDRTVKKVGSFDVISEGGKLKPKALQPDYRAPNGASMRPNTRAQKDNVMNFSGNDLIVYGVPAGTKLPDDLLLVHEKGDHFSLQPAKEMTVEEFNTRVNTFFKEKAKLMTREEWLQAYPEPTEQA
ncbi:hypothetical protein F9C07_10581 [Aspergillus flavus]|uniref:Tse2 ADP-ribosyltransferase toxin domain-containing protein n=1 Tax=Aspergillus flavus (strain ATCC 200026 / FGSC A1120 / IAM 13836 / NRRL 3357 / JCM 12722 / SRRC 167) TaxID=332952 RepID=A0A7G5KFJ2_ASPFN|nr:uncharacterized protein G4B84_006966 [Aspergillus flavus NRRL3357]QMW46634.1 hypothetical protein G4B11_010089 [Aspergillus flavus]KAF7621565.1 hypothetical protein AFLA_011861 [Aspergillus flavus NRRL3357]QMW31585.1 hypothetical protein G4B84_006966 [Aspergillus flavus NRRL3357]QRD90591.1 hypothetical protein F9C07_10581 [Aspergillus flavus]RAQ76843.1 hypothetical protein COH21_008690 [Aspergillus flavus]